MRGDDQLMISRMNDQIVNGNSRQSSTQAMPSPAAVPRNEQAKLCADVEQILVNGVGANHMNRAFGGQVRHDWLPGRAGIGGLEQVRPAVVIAVAVKRQKGCIRIKR